ncbi:MAG TPA: hypothetical protein H9804_04345 [Candidatus Mucispirillum faecigallinarum]|uniref:Uncharacterized protein n=1 Tax=Candidatus Mucispirillum faecigallinarum TaxID=2838699 RepID=A0A9D2KBV0_9BACT|nr:hypothetical protein [Candidatus Mucispirillum faecigallinarum]
MIIDIKYSGFASKLEQSLKDVLGDKYHYTYYDVDKFVSCSYDVINDTLSIKFE